MAGFIIDHRLLDSINLGGILLGVLGFFYLTYEFFGRKPLKWFVRIITPGLIGALILVPAGVLEYAYFVGFTGLVLRGGALYALVGGMIGIFNGIFVDWPSSAEKPPLFSWRGCLIGLVSSFLFGIAVYLVLGYTPIEVLIRAWFLAPIGGIAGGLWRFFKGVPAPSTEKPPLFSWKGCLIGLISAFLFGLVSAFIVDITFGVTLAKSLGGALTAVSFIGPAGAVTGGISRFIFWRADGLGDGKLGGIGAMLTLAGFLLQLLMPLLSILDIPVSH